MIAFNRSAWELTTVQRKYNKGTKEYKILVEAIDNTKQPEMPLECKNLVHGIENDIQYNLYIKVTIQATLMLRYKLACTITHEMI